MENKGLVKDSCSFLHS